MAALPYLPSQWFPMLEKEVAEQYTAKCRYILDDGLHGDRRLRQHRYWHRYCGGVNLVTFN